MVYISGVCKWYVSVMYLSGKCQWFISVVGARGGVVVKALRYKPTGRRFDSRWCHWNFSVTLSFWSHYVPGVDSASNSNEYQVYFLGVRRPVRKADNLTTHPVPLS